MKPKYFGTDGIRGKSFSFLTAEVAYKIGNSFRQVFNSKQLVIGADTRDSSPMLAHMVAAGALASGIDVIFAGVVPTPLIAHYSKVKGITGVMITASHNPYTDNGIKVMNNGYKSTVEEELVIESYIFGKEEKADKFGTFALSTDVELEYFKLIDSLGLTDSKLKVAYDSANGANYLLANNLMSKYFVNSKQIGNDPDGKNINRGCGSTDLDLLKTFIKDNKMDLGFAYDGDGDRLILVGPDGTTLDGDYILYILATHLSATNKLPHNTVVFTKMTNPGILKAINAKGINYILTDVGDKNVYKAMNDNGFVLGGESSGHVIISSILHSGDGLLASLYILKTLEEENISLADILSEVTPYPYKMVNIPNIDKSVLDQPEVITYLAGVRAKFSDSDIFLIRASGTEPLLRVTISCEDNNKLDKYINEVVSYLESKK